jgi:hypothetical protein
MSLPVRLSAIMEVIDLPREELTSCLNRKTGQIITFAEEEISAAEEGDTLDDYPEWQRDNIRMARDFLDNEEDYLALPTRYDLDEYRLIEKFSLSLKDRKASEILNGAIKGKGAFRRFKDALHRLNLIDQWHAYREDAVRQGAIDWCELNEIPFQDE